MTSGHLNINLQSAMLIIIVSGICSGPSLPSVSPIRSTEILQRCQIGHQHIIDAPYSVANCDAGPSLQAGSSVSSAHVRGFPAISRRHGVAARPIGQGCQFAGVSGYHGGQ